MPELHRIKYLAPGWFAVIMGTGGLANIFYTWRNSFPAGSWLGPALAVLAGLAYFFVLVPWTIRWLFYFEYVRRDLHHPVTINFFVTMPVATTIVGTNIYLIWSKYLGETLTYSLTFITWLIAVAGVTCFTFYNTFRMMKVENSPKPETMNFSWLMAPIANMAVLLIGNPVLNMTLKFHSTWAMTVFTVNLALFGIGFFLVVFISAIIFVRLAHHPLPPAELTPSFGILLSAAGLAVNALIDTAKNTQAMGLLAGPDVLNLGALIIWGFGIWSVGIIMLISIHQLRKGGIPFSLGWWAYIFPLAAYTLATQKVAACYPSLLTFGFAAGLTILLGVLWFYTAWHTVRGAINGRFFTGTPLELTELKKTAQYKTV